MSYGAEDPGLILTPVSMASNQFQFTMNAMPDVSYTIEASSNLLDWVAVATNTEPGITRAITITNPPDGQSFYRAARKPIPVFQFALAATGNIMFGGGVVDSFDSSVGAYDVLTNRNVRAMVVTDSTKTNAVYVGAARVYGPVITGPGGAVIVTTGAVGDTNWNATMTGIEAGWTNNDMNIVFATNSPPPGPFLTPTVTTTGGSNVTYLSTGAYQNSSFTTSSSSRPLIVTGNAIFYVSGNFTISGSGYVQIMPGASLTLYVGGTATFAGGGIVNSTGLAANFSYFGLNSNTSLTYAGSSTLIGSINAPQANFTQSGSGGMYGAAIANTINISGGGMHFDESLAANGPTR